VLNPIRKYRKVDEKILRRLKIFLKLVKEKSNKLA
jgi:hypothetical protein